MAGGHLTPMARQRGAPASDSFSMPFEAPKLKPNSSPAQTAAAAAQIASKAKSVVTAKAVAPTAPEVSLPPPAHTTAAPQNAE